MNWVISILLLFLVMAVHEGGHAIAAVLQGVPIKEYVIGLPYPSWLTVKIGKVRISPILILAGVAIDDDAFYKASLRKKILISLAGPAANLITGIAAAFVFLGFKTGWYWITVTISACVQAIGMLFTGHIPVSALVSPIGVVALTHSALQQDFVQGIELMWLVLSFAIPIFNLLPIPALDGGQIVLAIATRLGGNTPKVIAAVQRIILIFFIVITSGIILLAIRDVVNLF